MSKQPTGSYVIVTNMPDDDRIKRAYCRINTIKDKEKYLNSVTERLCLVKHISRAKIFDSLPHAVEWKNAKDKHSDIVKHVELTIKEVMV